MGFGGGNLRDVIEIEDRCWRVAGVASTMLPISLNAVFPPQPQIEPSLFKARL